MNDSQGERGGPRAGNLIIPLLAGRAFSCLPTSSLFKTTREALVDLGALTPVCPHSKGVGGQCKTEYDVDTQVVSNYRESRHLSMAGDVEKPSHFDCFFRCISDSGIIA